MGVHQLPVVPVVMPSFKTKTFHLTASRSDTEAGFWILISRLKILSLRNRVCVALDKSAAEIKSEQNLSRIFVINKPDSNPPSGGAQIMKNVLAPVNALINLFIINIIFLASCSLQFTRSLSLPLPLVLCPKII